MPDEFLHALAYDVTGINITRLIDREAVQPVQLTGSFLPIGGLGNGPHLQEPTIWAEPHKHLILRRAAEGGSGILRVKLPLHWR